MKTLALFLQIEDLFNGQFNWRGALQLLLFVVMGLIVVWFSVFAAYKAFKPKK